MKPIYPGAMSDETISQATGVPLATVQAMINAGTLSLIWPPAARPGKKGLDDYHSVEDIANRLDTTSVAVRRWIKQGALRAYRLPGKREWRILETDLRLALVPSMPADAPK